MPERVAAKKLTAENLRSIATSVSSSAIKSRLKKLPRILREWSASICKDICCCLFRATRHVRTQPLSQSLHKNYWRRSTNWTRSNGSTVKLHLIRDGRRIEDISRLEFQNANEILHATMSVLAKLSLLRPPKHWKRGPGQPRKIVGYLILQDAAVMFEWLHLEVSGKKATRMLNSRDTGRLEGLFHNFALTLWLGGSRKRCRLFFSKEKLGLMAKYASRKIRVHREHGFALSFFAYSIGNPRIGTM